MGNSSRQTICFCTIERQTEDLVGDSSLHFYNRHKTVDGRRIIRLYGLCVSSIKRVSVYPYCHLGFLMGSGICRAPVAQIKPFISSGIQA